MRRLAKARADGDKELELWILEGLDEAGYEEPPNQEVQPSADATLDDQTNNESRSTSTSTVLPFPTSGRVGT
jgi:hypothetical protein